MFITMSHSQGVTDESQAKQPDVFDSYSKFEMNMWLQWHKYWFERIEAEELPIYFIRFEELLANPRQVLTEIF